MVKSHGSVEVDGVKVNLWSDRRRVGSGHGIETRMATCWEATVAGETLARAMNKKTLLLRVRKAILGVKAEAARGHALGGESAE